MSYTYLSVREKRVIAINHVTHQFPYVSHSSRQRHEQVMPRLEIRYATHRIKSCRTYKWFVSHTYLSLCESLPASNTDESSHSYSWVISFIHMCDLTHINESSHSCKWVISLIKLSHSACIALSCLTHTSVSKVAAYSLQSFIYETVTSLVKIESDHAYKWVMSHKHLSATRHCVQPAVLHM